MSVLIVIGITAARARLSSAAFGALALPLLLVTGPALAVECGETVTGRARLDRDLVCTTDPAVTVDGGRPDLNGFTVVCDHDPAAEGVGVLLEGSGARLRDGAVTGCFLAVDVAGEGGHTVRRLTASAADRGVLLESDGNRLLDREVLRAPGDAAVQVDGSDNLLRGNTVRAAVRAFAPAPWSFGRAKVFHTFPRSPLESPVGV